MRLSSTTKPIAAVVLAMLAIAALAFHAVPAEARSCARGNMHARGGTLPYKVLGAFTVAEYSLKGSWCVSRNGRVLWKRGAWANARSTFPNVDVDVLHAGSTIRNNVARFRATYRITGHVPGYGPLTREVCLEVLGRGDGRGTLRGC